MERPDYFRESEPLERLVNAGWNGSASNVALFARKLLRELLKKSFFVQVVERAFVQVLAQVGIGLRASPLRDHLQGIAQTLLRYSRGERKTGDVILIGLFNRLGVFLLEPFG